MKLGLRELRRAAGFSLHQLADKLALSHDALSNYERGINKIPAAVVFQLATLYGVTAERVYELADEARRQRAMTLTTSE